MNRLQKAEAALRKIDGLVMSMVVDGNNGFQRCKEIAREYFEEYSDSDNDDVNIWPAPTVPQPDMDEMMEYAVFETGDVEATDGCIVEPDGVCPHGYPSWPKYWGLM